MPLGLLISGFLLGLVAAIAASALFGFGLWRAILVLVVTANLAVGLGALWRSRRRG